MLQLHDVDIEENYIMLLVFKVNETHVTYNEIRKLYFLRCDANKMYRKLRQLVTFITRKGLTCHIEVFLIQLDLSAEENICQALVNV